jgi:hypothetical protein
MQKVMDILKIVLAAATAITGIISIIIPTRIRNFTGLIPDGSRGLSEIRAVMGGVFLALGVTALVFHLAYQNQSIYLALGIMYLVIGLIRTLSIIFDKAHQSSNIISLAVEVVFGVLLLL